MTSIPILPTLRLQIQVVPGQKTPKERPSLRQMAERPESLPAYVRQSVVAMRYLEMLGVLDWDTVPERCLDRNWGKAPVPYRSFIAACLVKIDQGFAFMSDLHRYLNEHPALAWMLGFNALSGKRSMWGAELHPALPTQRHFARMLRTMPNPVLQTLLDSTVSLLHAELEEHNFGEAVSLDTKHILAWVRENNRKAYVEDRYDKTKQPKGDPDCRLGCKKRRNQRASSKEPPPTPQDNPVPAKSIEIGEFYWGYASGVVATKIPDWGEFVLAELTQPFDRSDVSYFFPLMADTERRLGFRPQYGAFDAAFDAAYVYEHFVDGSGFAAVPLVTRGGHKRTFSPEGIPLCKAGIPMTLKYTYRDRTHLIERMMERYYCPCLPEKPCPIDHKNAADKGCISTLAAGEGARIRYTLDRDSEEYKQVYKQRTAVERVNSQATALGIERPRLRNGSAITNLNTLIYVLINLRALQRVLDKKANSE